MNLSTNKLLAIAALICAILSYFVAGPLLLAAVILAGPRPDRVGDAP